MVVHTGDIGNAGLYTPEWVNADKSMGIVLNNNVPYTWAARNHDHDNGDGNPNGTWIGMNYRSFNATTMHSKSYWVSDEFLIINMEYEANSTVIAWMTNLISTHPSYYVIVAAHEIVDSTSSCGTDTWANDLLATLNSYPNVFLTLSGHWTSTDIGSRLTQ